jgi:hypothetical protein
MSKPRLPQAKAEASGAVLKNAGRFKDRKAPKAKALGKPYANMSAAEKDCWQEMAGDIPWLNAGHRLLVRLACYHAARLNKGGEFGVSATQALSSILSKLGATPVDETKVNHGGDGEEDPADQYFNGRPN